MTDCLKESSLLKFKNARLFVHQVVYQSKQIPFRTQNILSSQ